MRHFLGINFPLKFASKKHRITRHIDWLYDHDILTLKALAKLYEKCQFPAGNYMFKVSKRNTRTRCEICSKLSIKTPERSQ